MGKAPKHTSPTSITAALLTQLASGDIDALAQIYRKYYHRLLYYGLQVAGDQALPDVKDVVQELFIWMAKNYDRLESIQHFEAYLFQSVRRNLLVKLNLSQERLAKAARYQSRSAALAELSERPIELRIIEREAQDTLHQKLFSELESLPGHQWEVLYLRYYEGRSYKQIANILSISVQVARNFAHRGLHRLRQKMQGEPLSFCIALALLTG